MQAEEREAARDMELEKMKFQFEKWKVELQEQTKIEIARINAQSTLQSAQLSAAASGADMELDGEVKGKVGKGPMGKAAEKVQGTADSISEILPQIVQAVEKMMQAHEEKEAKDKQPQERTITMPSGRKYIRRDVDGATQIQALN